MRTSTSSANATGLPSRRTLIAQAGMLASMGTVGATVARPAMASEPGPIEAMWPEYLRLEAALDAAAMRATDAEELYEEPERPRWHMLSAGGYEAVRTAPGRGITYIDLSDENIALVRVQAAAVYDPEENYLGWKAAERARSTLAEIEAWQAEVKRRKGAAGLTEAEAAEQESNVARRKHVNAIFATEAMTFRELAFQAAILDVDWHQVQAERVLERLTELTSVEPYRGA